MRRKSSVMPIFWRSSGILTKIVKSLFIFGPLPPCEGLKVTQGRANGTLEVCLAMLFARPRLHLVLNGLLGRWNSLCGAALAGDFLRGRLRKMMRSNDEAFSQFASAQDPDSVGW